MKFKFLIALMLKYKTISWLTATQSWWLSEYDCESKNIDVLFSSVNNTHFIRKVKNDQYIKMYAWIKGLIVNKTQTKKSKNKINLSLCPMFIQSDAYLFLKKINKYQSIILKPRVVLILYWCFKSSFVHSETK